MVLSFDEFVGRLGNNTLIPGFKSPFAGLADTGKDFLTVGLNAFTGLLGFGSSSGGGFDFSSILLIGGGIVIIGGLIYVLKK